jgi:eukaryotic-like serine/threonine-protein kinase
MAITDPLVLPDEVVVVPVGELADASRAQLDCDDDDFVVTRPHGRPGSALIDATAVRLVSRFREPQRIVDAVVGWCADTGVDPEGALEDAFPVFDALYRARLLVEDGSPLAAPTEPVLAPGGEVGPFTVERLVQAVQPTDVYRAESPDGPVALKLVREPGDTATVGLLDHERRVLERLGGGPAPRVVATGEHEGRAFLASAWLDGAGALFAASELRRRGDHHRLLELCCTVAETYAALHDAGVIHGDVQPENVLVLADGSVKLVDFALAHLGDEPPPGDLGRAGVAYFFEPEYARALLAAERPPDASPAGEQYGLAALLYLMLSGRHYADFTVERTAMMSAIAEAPPVPLHARGADVPPAVEAALAKALRKSPRLRHGSVADLAAALRRAVGERPARRAAPKVTARTRDLAARTFALVAPDGALLRDAALRPPTASVNYGAAGIAYAWYRRALGEGSAEHLAAADAWCLAAERRAAEDGDGAWYEPAIEIGPAEVGACSLFHTTLGVRCVQALVATARDDGGAAQAALAAYVEAARELDPRADLVVGRAGVLLGAALLRDACAAAGRADPADLLALGDALCAELCSELAGEPHDLSVAHGAAGTLHAVLAWSRSPQPEVDDVAREALERLRAEARPADGGGVWWPRTPAGERWLVPSWCSGTAGHLLLWIAADRRFPGDGHLDIAERAGITTWRSDERQPSLCCGLAGRGYALAALHRRTGDAKWLTRARATCDRAAAAASTVPDAAWSLYKGDLGVALLACELDVPDAARMPLFEPDDWEES